MEKIIVTEAQIEEVVKSLNWGDYSLIIKNEEISFFDLFRVSGKGAAAGGIDAITDPDNRKVVFYLENINSSINKGLNKIILGDKFISKVIRKVFYKGKSKEEILQKMIRALVVHENRHCKQFDWILTHMNQEQINKLMKKENKSIYGMGILERDAYRYQSSEKHVPFEELFKEFVK